MYRGLCIGPGGESDSRSLLKNGGSGYKRTPQLCSFSCFLPVLMKRGF